MASTTNVLILKVPFNELLQGGNSWWELLITKPAVSSGSSSFIFAGVGYLPLFPDRLMLNQLMGTVSPAGVVTSSLASTVYLALPDEIINLNYVIVPGASNVNGLTAGSHYYLVDKSSDNMEAVTFPLISKTYELIKCLGNLSGTVPQEMLDRYHFTNPI